MSSARSKDSSSETESDDCLEEKTHSRFQSISSGIILKATYEHGKRNTEIMCVTYNERMRLFVIVDSSGITTWKRDAVEPRVHRSLVYPNYEYRLIANMVYAKKYNCYFVLAKDFSLKVYNKDFIEMCSVCAEMRSVMFMLFNPVRDELITGGVTGTQVWGFYQQSVDKFGDLRAHGSYGLNLKYELPSVGGGWVKHVELDHTLEHLYCCSDHDLYVYDLEGNRLFKFERAHSMSITGCRYSRHATVLVTSSLDSEVKVWSLLGGLVHIFRGHSRAVTNLILHPATSSIIITCSLDGTVRMWSLDTMDCLSSLVVSLDGIQWMGLTDDNLLYLSTPKALTLWNLNYNVQFWALIRSPVTQMVRCGCKGKTTRIVAISDDNSVRIMARSNSKSLTTVLPPLNISSLQRVMSVCYSREFSVVYLLINPQEIWVYTARTDPACRVAVWQMTDIQKKLSVRNIVHTGFKGHSSIFSQDKRDTLITATENKGEGLARCCSITILTSPVIVWSSSGYSCPIRDSYLLVGLEDGRIFFMDPVIKGERYLEFKTGKDPVTDMCQDIAHSSLITLHRLKDMVRILVWCVPDLTLQYELYTAADLKDFVRESFILMTGHGSGSVAFHTLEPVRDSSHHKTRNVPLPEELLNVNHKPEHLASILSVDVCATLKIFCSCSEDGCVKIWYEKVLLTEIMLDSSLSSVCFLNNTGDLLVGYQKHIFYIDHTKVCPQLNIPDSDVDSFDKESYIFEDPAVLFEGVSPYHDHVTLENYLVPFDIEFSKDFLEGRVTLEPETENKEVWESDDDAMSQISRAPTEIYKSAESTPQRRLSYVDLVLSSDVNRYDLLKQMKKTLDHLAGKESLQQKHLRKTKLLANDRSEKLKGKKNMDKKYFKSVLEKQIDIGFCFPHFGKSPEPTPDSSRPTTPEISVEAEEKLQELSTTPEVTVPVETLEEADEDSTVTSLPKMEDKKKPELKITGDLFAPRTKFGLADVKVDVKTLTRDTKKLTMTTTTTTPQTSAGPGSRQTQIVTVTDSRAKEKKSLTRERTVKKKKIFAPQRKNTKIEKFEKTERMNIDNEPPTQIHTLGLIELELNIPAQTSFAVEDLCLDMNETEVQGNEEIKSLNSLTSKLDEATIKDKESSAYVLSVPALPGLPLSESSYNNYMPSTLKSRSARSVKRPLNYGEKLCDDNNRQEEIKTDLGFLNADSMSRDFSAASGTLTDSAVNIDGVWTVSRILQDFSTSETEIIFEDQTEIKKKGKALPATSADIADSYEKIWQDKDHVSMQTCLVETADQHLNNLSSLHEQMIHTPRSDLDTQAHFTVVCRTQEATKTQSPTLSQSTLELNTPELQNVVRYFSQRPHTAHSRFSREDLQAAFEVSLVRYKQLVRSSLTSDKLYKNDDLEFSENWHERQIQRHMLLRMQAELRTLNVQENQQLLHQPEQACMERYMAEDMNTVRRRGHSSPQKLSTGRNQKQGDFVTTKQRGSPVPNASHRARTYSRSNPRASTVHGHQPVKISTESVPISSRPHTVSGTYHDYTLLTRRQSKQSEIMFRNMQQPVDMQTGLHQLCQDLTEKTDLKLKKPFRCRLQQVSETHRENLHIQPDPCQLHDPRLLDPRNPQSVRPRSSKSIPSKCYRYILVSRPKTAHSFPQPTRLEKYLLAVRFPQEGRRLFRKMEKLTESRSLQQADRSDNATCTKVS